MVVQCLSIFLPSMSARPADSIIIAHMRGVHLVTVTKVSCIPGSDINTAGLRKCSDDDLKQDNK